MPYGAAYASEFAKRYPDPGAYIEATDRMLMFLGRYAHQDATMLERNTPSVTLLSWVDRTQQLLREEDERTNQGR